METVLTGKTALVTGSTSGIGRGIAEHLAAQGCNIVLNGFGEAAEIEAQRAGITCDAIFPGWVRTPLVEQQIAARAAEVSQSLDEAQRDILAEKQPSGEFATPEQIGQLAGFLCSEGAAQITGAALNIDGGWLAR